MYLVSVMTFFLAGGLFALLLRLSLFDPSHVVFGHKLLDAETYNQFFTLHGAIMVFLFIIPSIPAALGQLRPAADAGRERRRVPAAEPGELLHLLDRARPWPLLRSSSAASTPAGRSTRLTSTINAQQRSAMMAMARLRPRLLLDLHRPELHRHDSQAARARAWAGSICRCSCWGMYATALIQVLATPVLAITLLLLVIERVFHIGIFDREHGRRSGAVPALLLVLFASGRLHHDSAGHGDASARSSRRSRARPSSAIARSPSPASRSRCSASWSGATTCSSPASRRLANVIFSFLTFLVAIPSGDQGLQLAGHHVPRPISA